MVRAREEDDRLSDLEIISLCVQLLVAGNVTTTDLMGNGLHALLSAPGQLAKLIADPALMSGAIEEMLRYDCRITETARIGLEDMTVAGCPVGSGDTLTLSLAAANRDPAVFADPHRFDVEQRDNPHLGFGSGVHVCLGAALARLEASVGIRAFLARFPDFSLHGQPPRRRDLPFFRGFETLPLRLKG
jgi:cytochrome P450